MTQFFFDFCQGGQVVEDRAGLQFESAEKAYLEAYEAALEMWGELLRRREDPRRCSFRVRDHDGAVLFSLPFMEVLESCRDHPPFPRSIVSTYRETVLHALRTRRLSAEFERELTATRAALKEASRLIAMPV